MEEEYNEEFGNKVPDLVTDDDKEEDDIEFQSWKDSQE